MGVFSVSVCANRLVLDRQTRSDALRFAALIEVIQSINSLPDERRPFVIKMLLGCCLSAHAKVTADSGQRGRLHELKNRLYLDIVNGPDRRLVSFRHLKSTRSKVVEKCAVCAAAAGETRCRDCKVDYGYYDLLQITHIHDSGSLSLVISNDRIARIERFDRRRVRSLPMPNITEQVLFGEVPLKCRLLRSISLDSLIVAAETLLSPKDRIQSVPGAVGLRQPQVHRRIRISASQNKTA